MTSSLPRLLRTKCVVCSAVIFYSSFGRPRKTCSDRCKQFAYRRRQSQRVLRLMTSSKLEIHRTPPDLFLYLQRRYGRFDLDTAASDENKLCPAYFTKDDDALSQTWWGNWFCNPPFGRGLLAWVEHATSSVMREDSHHGVMIVPARVGTKWWHKYVWQPGDDDTIDDTTKAVPRYAQGRISFYLDEPGDQGPAPFDCAFLEFRSATFRNAKSVTKVPPRLRVVK